MPTIQYLSTDFDEISLDLAGFIAARFTGDKWTDLSSNTVASLLLDAAAYLGDLLSYQVNAAVREALPLSAVRLSSLRATLRGFGYKVPYRSAATADINLTLAPGGPWPVTLDPASHLVSNGDPNNPVYFTPATREITEAESILAGHVVSVEFTEGEVSSNVLLGVSDGQAGIAYLIPATDLLPDTVEITVGGVEWTQQENFALSDADSKHFIVREKDGSFYAIFGDGQFGAIPAIAAQVRATFRVGGGRRGNLDAGKIETIVAMPATVLSLTNPSASSGGEEEPTLRQANLGFQASLSTLSRAVNEVDYSRLALTVAGVSSAIARLSASKSNLVRLWIAPSGGGAPSVALKNAVSVFFSDKKTIGKKITVEDPYYRDLRLSLLLHVKPSAKASDVGDLVKRTLINANGTGLFDFAQLGFAGLDADREPLLTDDKLKAKLAELSEAGLRRVEVKAMSVIPVARPRDGGNTGNGTATITLNGKQKRREYYLVMTAANTFNVYVRIPGTVSSISAATIIDESLDILHEVGSLASLAGSDLFPDRRSPTVSVTTDVSPDARTWQAVPGEPSFFTLTEVGADYYVQSAVPDAGTVGVDWSDPEGGNVTINLAAGGTPFIAGDSFTVDVYPEIGDISLKFDEFPRLLDANLTLNTSGGSKVL